MTYYLLASWEGAAYAPQFGDKDRDCVEYEARDWREALPRGQRSGATLIVRFPRVPTQRQVTARLAELTAARLAPRGEG